MPTTFTHQDLLKGLRSPGAARVRRKVIQRYNEQRTRYERAYAIVTRSMRQCRDVYAWIPVRLHDRSFVLSATL